MYSQVLPRVLIGGYDNSPFNVNVLDRANVSHVINMRETPLPDLAEEQFIVMQAADGEHDFMQSEHYWMQMMNWIALAYQNGRNVLYFHARSNGSYGTPVTAYAGLRSLGYTAIESRRLLDKAHPITQWFDIAMRRVDQSYEGWCLQTGNNPERRRMNMLRSLKENSIKMHEVADDSGESLYTN